MSASNDQQRYEKEEYIYDPKTVSEIKEEGYSKTAILYDLIKQLKTGGDLYRISLPSALLAPISMLEYISQYVVPHDYILNVSKLMDPEQRFLAVTKWWMSNLVSTPKKGIMHAKPYNAILGEVFRCKYIHEDSKTVYAAEQVSHHPPISAVYMANREKNFSLHCVLKPKSKFHGNSATTLLEGDIHFKVHNIEETYSVEFPYVLARGIVLGSQCIEIYEHLKITCAKTGFTANIKFIEKTNAQCDGHIAKEGKELYKVSGLLVEKVLLKSLSNKKEMVFFEAAKIPKAERFVMPVALQAPNESRRVWHKVSHAIKKADYVLANTEKHTVEQSQRELRKKREESAEKWVQKYFTHQGNEKYKCNFYMDGPYSSTEKSLEEVDLFTVTPQEVAFIKKVYPNHKSLAALKSNDTVSSSSTTTSAITDEERTEDETNSDTVNA